MQIIEIEFGVVKMAIRFEPSANITVSVYGNEVPNYTVTNKRLTKEGLLELLTLTHFSQAALAARLGKRRAFINDLIKGRKLISVDMEAKIKEILKF